MWIGLICNFNDSGNSEESGDFGESGEFYDSGSSGEFDDSGSSGDSCESIKRFWWMKRVWFIFCF